MSTYLMHRDRSIFPSPSTFSPARWLNTTGSRPPSRFLVPFSKGPRLCMGLNLANAELLMALAGVFRRLEFELWETEKGDVEMAADHFVPMLQKGSKGVRVIAK